MVQSASECNEEIQPVSEGAGKEIVITRGPTSPIHFKEKDITTKGEQKLIL